VIEAVKAAALRDLTLTVVTNNLEIARIGSSVPRWRVVCTGGTVRPGSDIMLGEPGESFFETIHADICFTGSYAVTGTILTDASMEVASIKRAMIRSARRTIVLADSAKFQAPAFCTFATLSQIAEVITDDGIDADVAASLRTGGTVLSIADVPAAGSLPRDRG
jgi:DeoR/GlpR family transcriptional regulator of sugar metabolism